MNKGGGFEATFTVMFGTKKAKATISFSFDEETFATWPISIHSVQIDVQVAYGPVR